MTDDLAEQLLAKIMNWSSEEVRVERPILQFLARYKYDEYQQFSPGMRFVQSLALWLEQFQSEERVDAYKFVRDRMIFVSSSEMNYLISTAYHDFLRPLIISQVSRDIGFAEYRIASILESIQFRIAQRRSLFLGLSDGAKTDVFRRSNLEISHEQVLTNYEIADERAKGVISELKRSLSGYSDAFGAHAGSINVDSATFQHIFLMDDFSGSGLSFLRESEDKTIKGKIAKFCNDMRNRELPLISDDATVHIVLYIATAQAKAHLEEFASRFFGEVGIKYDITVLMTIDEDVRFGNTQNDQAFLNVLLKDEYYDKNVETKSTQVGGAGDVKMGFANCAIPLILSHNTPNNSIFLLWSYAESPIRGLFPRFSRHRKDI